MRIQGIAQILLRWNCTLNCIIHSYLLCVNTINIYTSKFSFANVIAMHPVHSQSRFLEYIFISINIVLYSEITRPSSHIFSEEFWIRNFLIHLFFYGCCVRLTQFVIVSIYFVIKMLLNFHDCRFLDKFRQIIELRKIEDEKLNSGFTIYI